MNSNQQRIVGLRVFVVLFFILVTLLSVALGFALAVNTSNKNIENFLVEKPALPSVLLDRNGNIISELVGVEQRTLIEFNDLPKHQIFALLTREDNPFFRHSGFSIQGFTRAVFSLLINQNLDGGGGSTLTMQLAKIKLGNMFRRNVLTKLQEVWESWQIERQFSKQEIMAQYLNKVNFGHGAYGIEAVSEYFFGHSAVENSIAEAAVSVIQMANPGDYSPLRNPSAARAIQRTVIDQMIGHGYISQDAGDQSFATYWMEHDWSRSSYSNVHNARTEEDKAPWFTEYVREELNNLLYGTQDIYKDGYIIHTTLDLEYQAAADKYVLEKLDDVRDKFAKKSSKKKETVYNQFLPVLSMMGLVANIEDIKVEEKAIQKKELDYFNEVINPELRMMSLVTGISSINSLSMTAISQISEDNQEKIETGLITVDNSNGHILALIGGSKRDTGNMYNRALQAEVSPGSSFKPLYISAGISDNVITAGSHFNDKPTTFELDGADPWTPDNYGGIWRGDVLLRYAVNKSLNIPAIAALQAIGFDSAISRVASLVGITDPGEIRTKFDRKYPIGLGTPALSPVQMARAFATFANAGRANDPYGIRFIESQNGAIISHVEDEMLQRSYRDEYKVMSAQDAYVMTNIMETTFAPGGTLNYGLRNTENKFNGMAMAGKTGTSQNWKDSWTVGYSPYYTTSLWYGFDSGANTLGQNNNGAVLAGLVWSRYMEAIHKNLEVKEFHRPKGIVERTICTVSGQLITQKCEGSIREVYKSGTEPETFCEYHTFIVEAKERGVNKILDIIAIELSPDETIIDTEILPEIFPIDHSAIEPDNSDFESIILD